MQNCKARSIVFHIGINETLKIIILFTNTNRERYIVASTWLVNKYHLKGIGSRWKSDRRVVFQEKLEFFFFFLVLARKEGGGEGSARPRAAKEEQKNEGPRVAIRDYRCPEMLINLVLTLGLLLVIKQPWILLKSPTLYSSLAAAFYLSFLCACVDPRCFAGYWPPLEIFHLSGTDTSSIIIIILSRILLLGAQRTWSLILWPRVTLNISLISHSSSSISFEISKPF